jgi:hypothetical protein
MEGAFVTIHDASLGEDATLTTMADRDTNDDRTDEFLSSNGAVDAPYVADGAAVVAAADVTFTGETDVERVAMDDEETTMTDEEDDDDGR